jgi:hypothetical protein
MLQAGRSPVWVPDEVNFLILPNPSSHTMALGSTQPLTVMSTRNLPGGKKRLAHRADNVAAIYEPNVWKWWALNLSKHYGPPRPVQGKFYLFILKVGFHLIIYFIENDMQRTVHSRPLEAGGSQQKICILFILKFIQIILDLNYTDLKLYKNV